MLDFACSKLVMLEDAIAILEWVTHDAVDNRAAYETWEALRVVAGAGAPPYWVDLFWRASWRSEDVTRSTFAYAHCTAAVNAFCLALRIERSFRKVEP